MLESTVFFMCFVISQINELHVSISPWNSGRKVCSLYFMNINQLDYYDHLDKKPHKKTTLMFIKCHNYEINKNDLILYKRKECYNTILWD